MAMQTAALTAPRITPKQLANLKALRERIAKVPPSKIDMYDIIGKDGCGCAIFHGGFDIWEIDRRFGLHNDESRELFALVTVADAAYGSPNEARGAPAKRKFLRRLDAIIKRAEA